MCLTLIYHPIERHYLVVWELHERPLNALLGILLLLHLEDELVKLLLESLVRVVDAQLLKAVDEATRTRKTTESE